MSESNDLLDLLRIIYKWRKYIFGISALVFVASIIMSLVAMPNYYKSSVTFYPSNPTMTDRAILFSERAGENEIDYFGGNSDIDRLLTLANTSGTIDYIINRYKLFDHYDYDTSKIDGRYKTRKKFEKNYNTQKTPLGAVNIAVWDTDKQLAADMANHIALTIDNKNKEMIRRDKMAIIQLFETQLGEKGNLVESLADTLSKVKNSRIASEDEIMVLESGLENALEDLNLTSRLYEQYKTSANLEISTINITEPAFPAPRKDKPKRSLVVLGYTFTTFFLILILAVIVENYKKLKPRISQSA